MQTEIHHLLNRIRRRIRQFILAESAIAVALVLGLLFWIGLGVDWLLEPTRDVRLLAWGGVAAGMAWLLYKFAWVRLRRPLPDRSIALLVERAHPELHDRMTTAVAPVPATSSRPFLEYVDRQAAELSQSYQPAEVISFRPLRAKFFLALAAIASVVAFAVWQQDAFATWIDRLALSENRWPRRVHLVVEGFEPDKGGRLVRRIPRFETTEVIVHADLSADFEAPAEVQITFWGSGEPTQQGLFTRVGDAVKGREVQQAYRFTFDELREPLSLEIRGGDDRLTDLYLEVLPRPRIVSLEVDAEFPSYLEMSPRRLGTTSVVAVPFGTTLQFFGRASQPLNRIEATSTVEGLGPIEAVVDRADPREFTITLAKLKGSGELSLLPVDRGGVAAREPYLVALAAQPDQLPLATVRLLGIGTAVTPQAQLPVEVRTEDDHAVQQVWMDLSVADQPPQRIDAALPEADALSVTVNIAIDLESRSAASPELAVQPGQRLSLVARAQDAWNLTEEPRVGTSRMMTLDVVTADQLMESLEREEINLRRTFERVVEKTIQGRDKLQRAAIPENESDAQPLQTLRIELARVVDDVKQVTDEALAVAGGFQSIHDQLVNNRIGDDELKSRLRERIAMPLQTIAEDDLPPLALAIEDASRKSSPTSRDVANLNRDMRAVIDQMQVVLAEMKSLETYNEVVAMLRTLIQEQQTLTDKTRQDQRQQLEALLLED